MMIKYLIWKLEHIQQNDSTDVITATKQICQLFNTKLECSIPDVEQSEEINKLVDVLREAHTWDSKENTLSHEWKTHKPKFLYTEGLSLKSSCKTCEAPSIMDHIYKIRYIYWFSFQRYSHAPCPGNTRTVYFVVVRSRIWSKLPKISTQFNCDVHL